MLAWKSEFANKLTGNFFLNTIDGLTNAFVRPRYSGWPAFQQYLGETIHAFLKNDTDPLNILDHLQERYTQSYLNNE
jgi:multiple sugar transport system substrate-binding protein